MNRPPLDLQAAWNCLYAQRISERTDLTNSEARKAVGSADAAHNDDESPGEAAGDHCVPPQDRMIDPTTGAVWKIDGRLLLRKTWVLFPSLARSLLTELSAQIPSTRLSALATCVLDLTATGFTASVGSEICDFVLVLGHVLDARAQPSSELLGRLGVALALYRANPGLRIMTSGDGETLGLKECVVMRNWLISNGVPPDSVMLETESKDTVENLIFSTKLLDAYGAKSVVLVTSASHMHRAYSMLRAYLRQQRLALRVNCHAYHSADGDATGREAERFLLFKDLGRILGVWDYPQWTFPLDAT